MLRIFFGCSWLIILGTCLSSQDHIAIDGLLAQWRAAETKAEKAMVRKALRAAKNLTPTTFLAAVSQDQSFQKLSSEAFVLERPFSFPNEQAQIQKILVHTPPSYVPNRPWPLLLCLHYPRTQMGIRTARRQSRGPSRRRVEA